MLNEEQKDQPTSSSGNSTKPVLAAMWVDQKGRQIVISSMSDYWLNNIRKMFKGADRQKIQPIMDEIKRRKLLRSRPHGG